jgi:hypothetical protein
MRRKFQTSTTLTLKSKDLIVKLAEKLGLNKASIIEMAIRKLAEKEKVS